MATTKITSPDLFNLESLNTALKLPSGTTAERPISPSTGEWRYNTTTNLVEFWDGGEWRDLQSEEIPPVNSENFNTVLYNGTSATHAITGVGFKPDLVWIKDRNNAESHIWNDSTRGAGNDLSSNSINAQANRPTGFTSFDSDGFTLGTDSGGVVNDSSRGPYVAWCWKAGGGTTSSNTEGTITSTVQANTKAGFSIVKFVGTGANATVGHGLGTTPEIIIFKSSTAISGWKMFTNQTSDPANQVMELSDPNGVAARADAFNATLPTSTLFSLGTYSDVNNNGNDMMAYCFASVAGYSSIGSYTGNGSTNGPIVNTGFEPAFVIIKRTDSSDNWSMTDNKRSSSNPRANALFPNLTQSELTSGYTVDYLSNGFQIKSTDNAMNANGGTYLYIAFGSDASAAPALPDSFANKLYAGTGSPQSISGLGFSPSLVWLKSRNEVNKNVWTDSVRGTNKQLFSDSSDAESTSTDRITSFDSDGFTLNSGGSFNRTNNSGTNYVAWNWKANPIPTINTDGTIQSIVSASQAAGFSIVKYEGTGSNTTIGQGLSAAPEMIIAKSTSNAYEWKIWHKDLSSGYQILFNSAAQSNDPSVWTTTTPTSTVFSIGSNVGINQSGVDYIAYCFTSISGFSKIGSYVGNATSNRAITGLGFAPSWVMIKNASESAKNWAIWDSARGGALTLFPNTDAAEANETGVFVSLDSDGFTVNQEATANGNGSTIIYMAFKENPSPIVPAGYMAFLNIAGGASGGVENSRSGGGGGAGGFRTSFGTTSGGGASSESNITLAAGTYTITIGAGGASQSSSPNAGNDGNLSSIAASSITTISSVGGGGGGAPGTGSAGGSGGGGAHGGNAGGAGTANQGFAGGTGTGESPYAGAGGGGAGVVGSGSSAGSAGTGGNGVEVSITGTATFYAGGGGGGGAADAAGGTGGGGHGATGTANAGTTNTGSGGGGAQTASGAGGSGVVILRLRTSEYSGSTTGSPTVTTTGEETVLTYTGSGTYVHS